MVKAVIFDLDGVLVNTEIEYQNMLKSFLDEHDIMVSNDELNEMVGISSQNYKLKLEQWWLRAGNEIKPGFNLYNYFDKYCDKFPVDYDTIKDSNGEVLLTKLRSANCKIAVASSSPMKDITKILKSIEFYKFIDVIVSGDDLIESKPNPEIYNITVNRLRAKKDECIVIEDSYYGIEAAKNAGLTVIAKRDNVFGLDQSKADYIIDNLLQIEEFFHN